jgi:hypothetical protein
VVCSAVWLAIVGFDGVYYWQPSDWDHQWAFSIRPHVEWALGIPLAALAVALVFGAAIRWVRMHLDECKSLGEVAALLRCGKTIVHRAATEARAARATQ